MDEMASLCGYAEHGGDMDELGQKLLCATLELEKLKSEAIEEMRKNKEYVNQLILLLKSAIQERDEARNNLQKLITTAAAAAAINPPTNPAVNNPHLKPARANSSITESNSLSEMHNYHSHGGSSPVVDSLFDAASSPDCSSMNAAPFRKSSNFSNLDSLPMMMPKLDRGSTVIDNLVKGRVLPQKGMLLQTVVEAGPLLHTLMLAGPLPRWRNPPQMQPFQIPPVAIKGCERAEVVSQKAALRQMSDPDNVVSDFGNVNCASNASLISYAVSSGDCCRLPKRQRFC